MDAQRALQSDDSEANGRPRPFAWSFPIRWPSAILGPCPSFRGFTLLCWGFFIGTLVIPVSIATWMRLKATAPCDFVYFYGVGTIAKRFPLGKVYDLSLQLKTFNEVAYSPHGFYGPSPYPPFVAQVFSLFARLPFAAAFLLWMGISVALYITGMFLILKRTLVKDSMVRSLAICAALAFPPFVLSTWANGQIASIAFFAICAAIFLEGKDLQVASGFALSILAYKPTLLPLLLVMLLVTRRFKAFLGFLAGSGLLFLECAIAAGSGIWPTYKSFLLQFRELSGKRGAGVNPAQFVDLNSLLHGMRGEQSTVGLLVLVLSASVSFICLVRLLWNSRRIRPEGQQLVWATTLTWTLLLNVYVPMYDAILAVIAVTLTLGALKELRWKNTLRWFLLVALLTFGIAWFTGAIAQRWGVQPLTLFLILIGMMQFVLLGNLVAYSNVRVIE